jgi:anti-sigma regulatory factor (Ser/Thr protein kinase)
MCEATSDAEAEFEKSLQSPALAREFVEQHACSEHGARSTVALQLLASELVTNAALYGAAPITVRISCDGYSMRVDVQDRGRSAGPDGTWGGLDGAPGAVDAPVDARIDALDAVADGLGLLLVDKIAHEWGVVTEDGGRTFWGTIRTGLVPGQTPRSWPEPLMRTEAGSAPATAPH